MLIMVFGALAIALPQPQVTNTSCQALALEGGPVIVPDTEDAFSNSPAISAVALEAAVPSGYTQIFGKYGTSI